MERIQPERFNHRQAEPRGLNAGVLKSCTMTQALHILHVLSSMATKQLLNELVALYQLTTFGPVRVESVGGVDAAKRVQAGGVFDVVALAANAVMQLQQAGKITEGSCRDLVTSGVAIAVRSGAVAPDVASEEAVKQAVLNAKSIGYSTGPSGVQLAKLFERWGIADHIASRIVQAKPGVPVAASIASGDVELGFQQLSEMLGAPGIAVLGVLPPAIEIITTFSAGVASNAPQAAKAQALIDFMASPAAAECIRRNGMAPV